MKNRKVFLTVVLFSLVFALLLGLQWTLSSSLLKVQEVLISSEKGSEALVQPIRKDLLPQLQQLKGQWLWDVPLSSVLKVLEKDLRIQNSKVRRQLPGRLLIHIQPHLPLLLLPGAKGTWVPVGRDASLLSRLKSPIDLPLLRGAQFFEDVQLRRQAVDLMSEIPSEGVFHQGLISEVHFDKRKGFELWLTNGWTRVNMGKGDFSKRVRFIERVLNYLQEHKMQARVIDARFSKKVVVRLRNAP